VPRAAGLEPVGVTAEEGLVALGFGDEGFGVVGVAASRPWAGRATTAGEKGRVDRCSDEEKGGSQRRGKKRNASRRSGKELMKSGDGKRKERRGIRGQWQRSNPTHGGCRCSGGLPLSGQPSSRRRLFRRFSGDFPAVTLFQLPRILGAEFTNFGKELLTQ
jgi:hypothetical protein